MSRFSHRHPRIRMQSPHRSCSTTAYNLDGVGSSAMYFNGKIVNNPTTNGNTIQEMSVSDIVYIGQ